MIVCVVLWCGDWNYGRGASVSIVSQDSEEGGIEHVLLTALGTLELA